MNRILVTQSEFPMTAEEAARMFCVYNTLNAEDFFSINNLQTKEMLYPGRTLIAPERANTDINDILKPIGQSAGYKFRHAKYPPAPLTVNRSFTSASMGLELKDARDIGFNSYLQLLETRSLIAGKYFQPVLGRLNYIANETLSLRLAQMHMRSNPGNLLAKNHIEQAKANLRKAMQNLPKSIQQMRADTHSKMLKNSVRAFVHDGSPLTSKTAENVIGSVNDAITKTLRHGERIYIPVHVKDGVQKVANGLNFKNPVMRSLGSKTSFAGAALTAISGAYDIAHMRQDADRAQEKFGGFAHEVVTIRESAGIAANVGTGYAVGTIAGAATSTAAPYLIALGPVGWGGLAILGLCTLVGSVYAGKAAEGAAKSFVTDHLKEMAPGNEQAIDDIIKFRDDPLNTE